MGFKVNFTDNQDISAQELNTIASDIDSTGEKVSFSDGILYGVDDLNAITKSLITKGVSTGCAVTVSGLSVTINAGVLFFSDGKKVTIDNDGVTLIREDGKTNYVWFYNDTLTGVISAKCTTDAPSGEFVRIAEINPHGIVSMKRDKACMKNGSLFPNFYPERISEHLNITDETEGSLLSLDLGENYRRIVIIGVEEIAYIDFDSGIMYLAGDFPLDIGGVFGRRITIKSYLDVELVSYESHILTFKAYCSTMHGSVYGDLVIDCM